jgi:hypothetical protein
LKSFETEIVVRADRTAVVAAKLPDEVPAGKYRAVVLIEEHTVAETVVPVAGLPPLRWEGPLLVYDGALTELTDTEIKTAAFRALVEALGDVQAERFIALIRREPFDYTQWHRTLWPEKGVEEISQAAMKARR